MRIQLILVLLLAGIAYLSLTFGAISTPMSLPLAILVGKEILPELRALFYELRLPRMLLALLGGGSLAVCGLALQTLLRNPLASPDLLGISAGSSLGIVVSLLIADLDLTASFNLPGIAGAVAGALLSLGVLLMLAPLLSTLTLLLSGLFLSLFLGALSQLFLTWVRPESLELFYLWSQGSFTRLSLTPTLMAGAILLPFTFLLFTFHRSLDALLMGEEYARSLGVSLPKVRTGVLFCLGTLIGITTLATGPLGFIGVAVPHGARGLLRSHRHGPLFLASFLLGGTLALCADLFSRIVSEGFTYPVNALFALVGIPVIVLLLYRQSVKG